MAIDGNVVKLSTKLFLYTVIDNAILCAIPALTVTTGLD